VRQFLSHHRAGGKREMAPKPVNPPFPFPGLAAADLLD
jgi:hypothetical protein